MIEYKIFLRTVIDLSLCKSMFLLTKINQNEIGFMARPDIASAGIYSQIDLPQRKKYDIHMCAMLTKVVLSYRLREKRLKFRHSENMQFY